MAGPHVVIGIPTYGVVSMDFAMALMRLTVPLGATTCHYPLKVEYCEGSDPGTKLSSARNTIAEFAVQNGANKVFFVDDDVLVPPDAYLRLDRLMDENGWDICGGVYWSKTVPPQPLLWRGYMAGPFYDWRIGEVIEVDWTGCGCLCVRASAFSRIEKPWFNTKYAFFPNQKTHMPKSTEDIWFFQRAKQAGIRTWVDTSIQCVHQDRSRPFTCYTMPEWQKVARPGSQPKADAARAAGTKLIANIGCGPTSIPQEFYGQAVEVVRFDIDESARPDVRCDVRHIPEPDGRFDVAYASHILEHFPPVETMSLLAEWVRILKAGGELIVKVPDLEQACKAIVDGTHIVPEEPEYELWMLWGKQTTPHQQHYCGFNVRLLENALRLTAGLTDVTVTRDPQRCELVGRARKVGDTGLPCIAPKDTFTPANPGMPRYEARVNGPLAIRPIEKECSK